jgi:hypothetical protein
MTRYLLTFILILFSKLSIADVWELPKIKRYFSEDSIYMVKVYPLQIPEKYSKWKSARPNKKKRFTEKDTILTFCHAILYKIENSDTTEVWNKKLTNAIMPEFVIVANDGSSIVTFDNWSSLGYGPDVMVTYDRNGILIKKYKLEDFSPFPINDYLHSVSSIWWNCGAKYIDNQTIQICFQDEKKAIKTKQYNLTTGEFN